MGATGRLFVFLPRQFKNWPWGREGGVVERVLGAEERLVNVDIIHHLHSDDVCLPHEASTARHHQEAVKGELDRSVNPPP